MATPQLPRVSERLLLQEISHRVNNELAAAIGIASAAIARASSDDVRAPLARIRRCLESFAQAHHVLTVPELRTDVDGCAYLRTLCAAISAARLESNGIELSLVAEPVQLDSERNVGDWESSSPS